MSLLFDYDFIIEAYLKQVKEEGIEAGRKEGIEISRQEGVEIGRKEGFEIGVKKRNQEISVRMKLMGYSDEEIAAVLD